MKPGDMVRNKNDDKALGLFLGLRTFDGTYECAEVMWFTRSAPNGDRVSTIQKDLIEVVSAAG